jgi:hypothetical protein
MYTEYIIITAIVVLVGACVFGMLLYIERIIVTGIVVRVGACVFPLEDTAAPAWSRVTPDCLASVNIQGTFSKHLGNIQ